MHDAEVRGLVSAREGSRVGDTFNECFVVVRLWFLFYLFSTLNIPGSGRQAIPFFFFYGRRGISRVVWTQ